jgi:tagatose 1,6-diphosphate aldolase
MLLPLARAHGLTTLWITCNPDNIASRRTCERIGARLVEVVDVPEGTPLYRRGERQKCRYCLEM